MVALIFGLLLGFILRAIYEANNKEVITQTIVWYNVVANGYVRLLQMLIMPLIFVSITCAILNIKGGSNIGRISLVIIGVLVVTTGIAAFIGAMSAKAFSLNAQNLLTIVGDISKGAASYQGRLETFTAKPNAALITLSALGFPVELVAVLLGIEPLIDMGRTLVNVNDGMVTAAVAGKVFNEVDMDKFNSKELLETDSNN